MLRFAETRFFTFRSVLTRTSALAPLGERVARRGVFISRGETGEGGQTQRAFPPPPAATTQYSPPFARITLGLEEQCRREAAVRSLKIPVPFHIAHRLARLSIHTTGGRSFHGFDPLTRPAPAGESAGCGPPSPPRGRGLRLFPSTVPFFHRAPDRKCTNSRERQILSLEFLHFGVCQRNIVFGFHSLEVPGVRCPLFGFAKRQSTHHGKCLRDGFP
jgi:hypothetical protein